MSLDRPQYGEYATPEEQRIRAGLPPVEPEPTASAPEPVPAPVEATTPARRSGDRFITAALLGVGLVNVLTSIGQFTDLASTMNLTLQMLGIDAEFTNFAAARTWGVVSVFVLVLGYAVTAWLAIRRIVRKRTSWWIPLVGFAVTMMLVSACISVPMFGDPAFTEGLLTTPTG